MRIRAWAKQYDLPSGSRWLFRNRRRGRGQVVELGPWRGAWTHHIVLSLAKNPRFTGEQLNVFDDFTWRA